MCHASPLFQKLKTVRNGLSCLERIATEDCVLHAPMQEVASRQHTSTGLSGNAMILMACCASIAWLNKQKSLNPITPEALGQSS